jgi:ribose/xylose/arabinose/galactoside ABC-type transport system permease subunit
MSFARAGGLHIRMARTPEAAPFVFLVLLSLFLAATTPGFASADNLLSILVQVAVVGIVALAVNQVILAGEIDVSTGSILALCCFVYGETAQSASGLVTPLIAALSTGTLAGAVNGALVTVGRVPSIITTLGVQLLLRGVVLLWAAQGVLTLPARARWLGLGLIGAIPVPLLLFAGTYFLLAFAGHYTNWGRRILAVGGNPRAARAIGLPVEAVRFGSFLIVGFACGLASAVFAGQLGEMQATVAKGFELQVIAAVVLGGTRITGGRGSASAPVIGAALVGVVLNALTLNRVSITFEQLALGALILAAIVLEALRSKVASLRSWQST